MRHLTNIDDIEQTLAEHHLCLFYIKAPDCGVCTVYRGCGFIDLEELEHKIERHIEFLKF